MGTLKWEKELEDKLIEKQNIGWWKEDKWALWSCWLYWQAKGIPQYYAYLHDWMTVNCVIEWIAFYWYWPPVDPKNILVIQLLGWAFTGLQFHVIHYYSLFYRFNKFTCLLVYYTLLCGKHILQHATFYVSVSIFNMTVIDVV